MEGTTHVFAPVANALGKAGMAARDLDAVLFIGGSAINPIVRRAVMDRLPNEVRKLVPKDLQAHVSRGAAIHAFCRGYHNVDVIAPITPEDIFVITRGGGTDILVRAGTAVPMTEPVIRQLEVEREGQPHVDLPICVGSDDRLLGKLRVDAPDPRGFSAGTPVRVAARINHEKLLEVTAEVEGRRADARLLHPLTNAAVGMEDAALLQARQAFNEALLEHRGRPPIPIVKAYARAAESAG